MQEEIVERAHLCEGGLMVKSKIVEGLSSPPTIQSRHYTPNQVSYAEFMCCLRQSGCICMQLELNARGYAFVSKITSHLHLRALAGSCAWKLSRFI